METTKQGAIKAAMLGMVQLLRARGSAPLEEDEEDTVSTITEEHILAVVEVALKQASLTPEQLRSARDEVQHECSRHLYPVLGAVNTMVGGTLPLQAGDARRIVGTLWRFWSGAQPTDTSVLDMCRRTGFEDNRIVFTQTSLPPFLNAYTHAVIGTYLTLRGGVHPDMAVLAGVMYRSSAVVQHRLHHMCGSSLFQIKEEFAEGVCSRAGKPRWAALWAAYFGRRVEMMSFADARMRDALAAGGLTFTPEFLCAAMTGRLFADAGDASGWWSSSAWCATSCASG